MTLRNRFSAAAAVLALFSFVSSARAATICVNPNRNACEETIQDAVDAASAGDTIELASRTFFENVVIPSGKNRLTIKGSRSAILDAGDDGIAVAPNAGHAIQIGSNNVKVNGITIRNGDDDHFHLDDDVTGTKITDVLSVNAEGYFVYGGSGNDDTTIRDSVIFAPDYVVFIADGDGLRFVRNQVRQASNEALGVTGDDAVVEENTLVGIENGDAIQITGNNAEVVQNKINGIDDAGINVDGNDALVANNRLTGTYAGIEVDGQRPVVRNNRVNGTVGGSESIEVDCDTDCTGAKLTGNETSDIGDDTYGFGISASASGMLIAENVTKRGIDTGFYLEVDGATIRDNRVVGTGGDQEACFEIDGDDNNIKRNVGKNCMGNGFDVSGEGNTLRQNRVRRAGDDGFVVRAGSIETTLDENRSMNNGLTGFRIQDGTPAATDTTVTGNVARGSRYDICDEGSTTTRSGNDFGKQLAVTQDGTEDCPTY